jgi:hypothetical protein
MHSNEESVPLKAEAYADQPSNYSEQSDVNPSQCTQRRSRLRMGTLGILFGVSLILNTIYLLRDIRILVQHEDLGNSFETGFSTDFSEL